MTQELVSIFAVCFMAMMLIMACVVFGWWLGERIKGKGPVTVAPAKEWDAKTEAFVRQAFSKPKSRIISMTEEREAELEQQADNERPE